jgi:3-dehydroquinate synthase
MKEIKVNLKKDSYLIIVGSGVLSKLGTRLKQIKIGNNAFIITNSGLKARFGKKLNSALVKAGISFCYKLIPDTEHSKSLTVAARVLSELPSCDRNKGVFIVALGGGVAGDLSGFVASIYRRGIPYIQLPTSLLAQVDSSIGGKTAVDLRQGKNLAGSFYQPKLVLSDIDFLKTLDKKQLSSGLAEVIKYAVIADRELFVYLEKNLPRLLAKDRSSLEFIVARCAAIKARIVSLDEKEEKGLRTVLNFGHTLGHAIEAAGKFSGYSHGEAVGLGMLAACGISRELGLLGESDLKRIESLVSRSGLPTRIKGLSFAKIISAHYLDKKFIGAKNRFVLACGIGRAKVKAGISLEIIKRSLKERF